MKSTREQEAPIHPIYQGETPAHGAAENNSGGTSRTTADSSQSVLDNVAEYYEGSESTTITAPDDHVVDAPPNDASVEIGNAAPATSPALASSSAQSSVIPPNDAAPTHANLVERINQLPKFSPEWFQLKLELALMQKESKKSGHAAASTTTTASRAADERGIEEVDLPSNNSVARTHQDGPTHTSTSLASATQNSSVGLEVVQDSCDAPMPSQYLESTLFKEEDAMKKSSAKASMNRMGPELVGADEHPPLHPWFEDRNADKKPAASSSKKGKKGKIEEVCNNNDWASTPLPSNTSSQSSTLQANIAPSQTLPPPPLSNAAPPLVPSPPTPPSEPTFYAVEATLVRQESEAVVVPVQQPSAPVYDAVLVPDQGSPPVLVPSRAKYKRCIFTGVTLTFVIIGVTVGAIIASKNSKQANSDSPANVTQVGGSLIPTASPTASPSSPPTISCYSTVKFKGYLFEPSCGTCDPIVKVDRQTLMISRNQENIQFGSYIGGQFQPFPFATFEIDYDVSDIAIFGSVAVVGASSVDNDSGVAFVFEKDISGQWDQPVPIIRPINISAGALFGYSVDIGKNNDYFVEVENESKLQSGDHFLAVGAPNDGEGSSMGSVFIFRRNNTTWEQDTILRPPDLNSTAFGSAVSVNGDIIVVGDPHHRHDIGGGAVFVYVYDSFSNEWVQANTPIINDDCDGEFGASILLTVASGLLIGCPKDDSTTGAVYYYVQSGTEGKFIFQQKVVASDGVYRNNFGGRDSIAVDGKLMVVGTEKTLGGGGVYIFAQVNSSWTELASIDVPQFSEHFGRRAALFENNAIVSSISNAYSYSYSISQCLGVKESIEVEVLQRGAIFDGMDEEDPRYRALDWILHRDGMQLDGNANNLHQRYILALIAFSLDLPAWERCVRVRTWDNWNINTQTWNYDMTNFYRLDNLCVVEDGDEDATSADYSSWLSSWLSDADECMWYGVTCIEGFVHRLDLSSSTLIGEIPPEISKLQYVQFVSLGRNCLYGTIPSEIGKLTSLESLDLSHNGLSGYIPDEMFELSSLVKLDVGNQFLSISSLVKLEQDFGYPGGNEWKCTRSDGTVAYMGDNNGLQGQILGSKSIKKLRYLNEISISGNSFSGEISSEIGNLKQLVVLNTGFNSFIGSIPEEITKLENLRELDFEFCSLSGELPSSIGNMKSLDTLNVYVNNITGTIPESLYNLTELYRLDLESNQFSGTISKEIGNLKKLKYLLLSDNLFLGSLPTELGLCHELEELWMRGNNMTGTIPDSLYNLSELYFLSLSENQFSGTISKEIGNLKKLEVLRIYNNAMNGTIPESLYNSARKLET